MMVILFTILMIPFIGKGGANKTGQPQRNPPKVGDVSY
jgi:hypothetical protein